MQRHAGGLGAGNDDRELPAERRASLRVVGRIGDAGQRGDEALVDLDVVGGVLADGVERERQHRVEVRPARNDADDAARCAAWRRNSAICHHGQQRTQVIDAGDCGRRVVHAG